MIKKLLYLLVISVLSISLISCSIINNNSDVNNSSLSSNVENPIKDDKSHINDTSTYKNNPSSDIQSFDKNYTSQNQLPKKEGSIKTVNCRIFLFDTEKLQLYYVNKNLSVEDNALVTALTKELQTNNDSTTFLKLTNKVGIKSANLDTEKGILTVVFDKSYVNEIPLGSATESGLLSSLVNTYGYNYNVDKVAIYFGNEPYTSLKGDLPEGYFKTNFTDIKAYEPGVSTPLVKEKLCRLYFYDGSDDCFYYTDSILEITDNALVTALTSALKLPPKDTFLKISETTSVINASLDSSKEVLTVNLSKNYYDILSKVGSGSEISILQSLAMTYGYNYEVNKVIILVDNKPYSGSHIEINTGDYVNFDLSIAKSLD